MRDRLDKGIEMANKIAEECEQHEECERCPYKNKDECIVSDVYVGMQYLSTIIPKEPFIQLKNIDLEGYTLEEEKATLLEEINELIKITVDIDANNSFEHFCEETFDILQVCIGIAEKKYQKSADDVMKEYSKHILKMEQRGNKPREGKNNGQTK